MKMTIALPKAAGRSRKKGARFAGLASGVRARRSARRKETARAGRVIVHKFSADERVTDEDMRRALDA